MTGADFLTGIVIAVGVAGILVPFLPGTLLVMAAIAGWALITGSGAAWGFAGVAIALLVVGSVIKYVVPGRRLRDAGVPTTSLVVAASMGIVGFFVVPVVGLVLGFVGGLYLAERMRLGAERARGSTLVALRAVGLSLAIELTAALLASAVWFTGVLAL